MCKNEKNAESNKNEKNDAEFSTEFNIGLDYNANLQPDAKEEISKVKEFYDSRL